MGNRNFKVVLSVMLLAFSVFLMFFVLAAHDVTTSTGGTSFSVNGTVQYTYNITVNNTDAGYLANITSVNVTLPSGASCTFADGSNSSSVGSNGTIVADSFVNVSNTLSWTNTTGYVINGTEWKYFWFNATCTVLGTYNITVRTTNVTGDYETNISFEVKDEIVPTASFGINPIADYNSSSSDVVFDLKCADGYALGDLMLYSNWSGSGWHANQTNSSPVHDVFWNVTVSGISDGTYKWAAYCNDSSGNIDWTATNRTLTVDATAPTITLPYYTNASVKKNTDSLTLNISVVDSGSGLSGGACLVDVNGTNQSLALSDGWCNSTNVDLTNLVEGNQTIKIYVNDSFGNWGLNDSFVVWIDNDVVSGCEVLTVAKKVYTLNQSIGSGGDGDCIIIANEGIVLDCVGYNITYGNSTGGNGILNMNDATEAGYVNVTVRNCVIIQNGSAGVNLNAIFFGANSTNSTIYNNTVMTSKVGSAGMFFEGGSVNVNFSLNNVTTTGDDSVGVYVGTGSNGSNLGSNIVATSGVASLGILLNEDSVNGIVFNNTVTTSAINATGIFLHTGGSNVSVERNTVTTSANDSSGILMGDSLSGLVFNNTVIVSGNLSLMDAMGGIFLEQNTEGINVSSNNVTSSGDYCVGIWVWGANHSVDGNTITATGEYGDGIYMTDGTGTNLTSNTITVSGVSADGIHSLTSSSSSLLFDSNIITTSANYSYGIFLKGDNYNNISSNNITTTGNASYGVYFNQSHHATLSGNIIETGEADSYVLYLLTAANHSFYNNIFNTSTSGSGVSWVSADVSYFNTTNTTSTNIVGKTYVGGNFWTNVNSTGYSDRCTNLNSDYFCDSIYDVINSSNPTKDYLPLSTKIGWNFNGTVMDANGAVLNNSVVNITTWTMGAHGLTLVGSNFSNSSSTGIFNTFIDAGSSYGSYMYKSVITHTNASTGAVDYVGQVLPPFPYTEFSALSDVNFYLKEAGTMNVTAVNTTGGLIPFGYMIKDTKLGYEVSMDTNVSASGVLVYVPRGRNYSIMVWPAEGDSTNHFVPVSYDWSNFTATEDYDIGSLSKYNYTTKVLSKQFNVSESFSWVSGYINKSNIASWDSFTVVPYLLEPSDMVGMTRGGLPYNASAWRGDGSTDSYNVTSGFYNITLPYSVTETVRYLLLAVAENGSTYYGGYRNITIDSANEVLNFTMYGFLGSTNSIINMSDSMDGSNHIVNLTKQTFNLVNASNTSQMLSNISAHIEVDVDYSDYGCMEFTFMEDISVGDGSFSIPLLNVTGVKEMNIYSQTYAPRRISIKSDLDIQTNPNVTMAEFSPGATGGGSISGVQIGLYISNSTCDVPNPPAGCVATSSANLSEFNPLKAVVGGGALSFRMGLISTGIIIHYVNVDLLASGPPSGEFESGTSESTSSGFESALKFGSNGPTIYDYILISMPYTEGSSSVAGLNESASVNLSIPKLYDESWSSPIWDTSLNGTNGTLLAGNYSHYSARSSEWATLIGDNVCGTNVSEFNATNPCYINTTSNRIWIRLPHFSGTEPSITGSATVVTTTPDEEVSSSGGGGGDPIYQPTEERLREGYTLILRKDYKVKFDVDNESHTLNVDSVGADSVQITVSSEPQTKTLSVGDEVKFELDGDNVYDFSVRLESIGGSSAKLLMKRISEEFSEGAVAGEGEESLVDSIGDSIAEVVEEAKKSWVWWLVGGLVLLGAVVGAVVYFRKRR